MRGLPDAGSLTVPLNRPVVGDIPNLAPPLPDVTILPFGSNITVLVTTSLRLPPENTRSVRRTPPPCCSVLDGAR